LGSQKKLCCADFAKAKRHPYVSEANNRYFRLFGINEMPERRLNCVPFVGHCLAHLLCGPLFGTIPFFSISSISSSISANTKIGCWFLFRDSGHFRQ